MGKKAGRSRESDQKDLWNENRTLRKQIKSLQREINRARRELGKAESYKVDEESEDVDKQVKVDQVQCKSCGSKSVKVIELEQKNGKITYSICQQCGHRTKA